ncbi:MAG: ZIP zinc transporter [Candidatus Muproteobacteria bacterium RBG_16_64_11]|uniref:ZIP zinc transporter n=1 Tax=Candidatus Muproteobacteria bacterium RBG_16_64_11 TaxID=1817758 RepID=A0A1F6TFL9_9PROT|nr:MAG: ZIP zinc transporter [Candidatus Muproteobacteria bacterium RBG_16_64_11]
MPLIVWILLFTVLGGVLSVLAAALFLALPQGLRTRLLPGSVSFAVGALLGAAFLALLPHALESPGVSGGHGITAAVLLGLLAFFVLEKLVLWRHCHLDECEAHGGASVAEGGMPGATETHAPDPAHGRASAAGYLILVGDGIHNLVDGVLIGAAFLTDVHLGIVTSLAVVAHEIPQEVGDFAILLHSGFSRGKALAYNVLASLTTVIGGVAAYFALSLAQGIVPYVLAVAASSFIYIAVADLIPGLHQRVEGRATVQQVVLIALGVAVIFITHSTLH